MTCGVNASQRVESTMRRDAASERAKFKDGSLSPTQSVSQLRSVAGSAGTIARPLADRHTSPANVVYNNASIIPESFRRRPDATNPRRPARRGETERWGSIEQRSLHGRFDDYLRLLRPQLNPPAYLSRCFVELPTCKRFCRTISQAGQISA